MKYVSATILSLALAANAAQAQTTIQDSFESGDLSASGTSGLKWGGTNSTSLVKRDSVLGDLIIFNGNGAVEIQEGFDKDWRAKDGSISMRFDFDSGKNSWAEQRFSLSSAQEEIWIGFWLRVPKNFRHSSNSPSNSKLFALWMDDYSSKGAGPTVIWEFWNDGSDGSKLAYHYSPGGYKTANSHKQHKPFIRYPADQGRWMQVVLRVKAASRSGANDGVIETYRRWEDESSFSKLHEDRGADIAPASSGPQGWKAGYIMGWSNPGYSERTEWLLDDFQVSSSSLLRVDSTDGPSSEPAPAPTPDPVPDEAEYEAPAEDGDGDGEGDGEACRKPQVPLILSH